MKNDKKMAVVSCIASAKSNLPPIAQQFNLSLEFNL